MENKHYDNKEFRVTDSTEMLKITASGEEVYATIKKSDNIYYITMKESTIGSEMMKFSTPSYPRAVVEFKLVAKVFLDAVEEIAWEESGQ